MSFTITAKSSLDWPKDQDCLEKIKIDCIGENYVTYNLRRKNLLPFFPDHLSNKFKNNGMANDFCGKDNSEEKKDQDEVKKMDLLKLSEAELEQISFYDALTIPMHATPDNLRKAYHKACLRYHPDKTGRGEEDHVFLKIKEAFDTLSDPVKRRSYDSSLDFDDSIPKDGVKPKKFFEVYEPVFTRNLRFAVHVDDTENNGGDNSGNANANANANNSNNTKNGKKSKGRKKKNNPNNGSKKAPKKLEPPSLGHANTPIEQVHAFYEYWTHFQSWRDFTLVASKSTEHDVDAAECREEKRWMAKEIERKAKNLKKQEMLRIQTLVSRAMAADPRLKMEKERLAKEKQEREEARKRKEEEQRLKKEADEAMQRIEKEKKEQQEKKEKAEAKLNKEKHKKALRKAKQSFRKLTIALFKESENTDSCWTSLDEMNDEVELLCSHLDLEDILYLNSILDAGNDEVNTSALSDIRNCVSDTKESIKTQSTIKIQKRDAARAADKEKVQNEKMACAMKPWTKEELSALAKAVKKYPPGGANRWEAISLFVNNLCKSQDPRSKEHCIEAYNKLASNAENKLASLTSASKIKMEDKSPDKKWTEEQDKQLQEGLAKYPSSMDKNERWSTIAKGVTGKGKKDCVERFKEIRSAIKNKAS